MSQNRKIALGVALALLVGYSFGRWATPTKVEIQKEIVTVEKKVVDTEELKRIELDRNKKLRTIITEITRPDGTKEKTTRHVETTTTNKKTDIDKKTKEETTKEVTQIEKSITENDRASVTISALAGVDVLNLDMSALKFVYGGHIQKSIIGPVQLGVFGLTNGTCGLSLGLSL